MPASRKGVSIGAEQVRAAEQAQAEADPEGGLQAIAERSGGWAFPVKSRFCRVHGMAILARERRNFIRPLADFN